MRTGRDFGIFVQAELVVEGTLWAEADEDAWPADDTPEQALEVALAMYRADPEALLHTGLELTHLDLIGHVVPIEPPVS